MSYRRKSYCAILIFLLAFPGWSGDYNRNRLGIDPLKIFCLISSLIPVVSAGIEVTDQWSFNTTNAQSILGTLGFLSMGANFFSAWWFYRKTQEDLSNLLQQRIDELKKTHGSYEEWDNHLDYSAAQVNKYLAQKLGAPCDRAARNINVNDGDLSENEQFW